MSQCGREQSMCRSGGVRKAAARCWVAVPNHETSFSLVQDLVAFRLATCLVLKIIFGGDTVAIRSQCGREQSMCRSGGVGTAAALCWVGVPNHVMRLSVVQDLVAFRLATCLFLKLDTVAIMSQCGRGQSTCRLGGVSTAAAQCWVGIPNHVMRLSVVQDLVAFRLATCSFSKSDLVETLWQS